MDDLVETYELLNDKSMQGFDVLSVQTYETEMNNELKLNEDENLARTFDIMDGTQPLTKDLERSPMKN